MESPPNRPSLIPINETIEYNNNMRPENAEEDKKKEDDNANATHFFTLD